MNVISMNISDVKPYPNNPRDNDEAEEMVMPYLNAVNKRAKELAVKFGMKPKKVNFYSFVR